MQVRLLGVLQQPDINAVASTVVPIGHMQGLMYVTDEVNEVFQCANLLRARSARVPKDIDAFSEGFDHTLAVYAISIEVYLSLQSGYVDPMTRAPSIAAVSPVGNVDESVIAEQIGDCSLRGIR